MKPVYFVAIICILIVGCEEELIIIGGARCSNNDTYCEDVRLTNMEGTVYQNMMPLSDNRDSSNNTFYEEILP